MVYGVSEDASARTSDHGEAGVDGAAQSDGPQVDSGVDLISSVIVIEPRALARDCLVAAIHNQSDLHVSAFANIQDWRSVGEPLKGKPVLLMSVADALTELSSNEPLLRVLRDDVCPVALMADDQDPERIARSLELGVRGYIPTSLSLAGTVRALRFVADGGTYVPASSLLEACNDYRRQSGDRDWQTSGVFTPRQSAVIRALCLGKPNKVIAYELKMCESTVKVHIRNIMKKLKAKNRTEVVIMAQKLRANNAIADGRV